MLSIDYRTLDDKRLIGFCETNLTENAKMVLGVFQDVDGTWKIENSNYAYLVRCFFEAQILTKGALDGQLDFELRIKTSNNDKNML